MNWALFTIAIIASGAFITSAIMVWNSTRPRQPVGANGVPYMQLVEEVRMLNTLQEIEDWAMDYNYALIEAKVKPPRGYEPQIDRTVHAVLSKRLLELYEIHVKGGQ